jgi:hypothetical protein
MYSAPATLCAALLLVACGARDGDAQELRTLTSARSHAGEDALRVEVVYAAGRMRIEPGPAGSLYRARLDYDERFATPVADYRAGLLRVGLEGMERVRLRRGSSRDARMDLALGRDPELDLKVEFGAAEARMELGGLKLRSLRVATGASDTKISFAEPNPIAMDQMSFDIGAAAFHVAGIGNANARRLTVNGGVGDVALDFGGRWSGNMDAQISMGLGSLSLVLPRDVGVEIRRSGFLASFSGPGLEQRGNAYYSGNWDSAAHRLTIRIDAAFGSIDVRWIGSRSSEL